MDNFGKLQKFDVRMLGGPGSANGSAFADIHNILKDIKSTLLRDLTTVTFNCVANEPSQGLASKKHCPLNSVLIDKETSCKYHYTLIQDLCRLLNALVKLPCNQNVQEVAVCMLDIFCLTLIFLDEYTRVEMPAKIANLLYEIKEENFTLKTVFMKSLCRKIIPVCYGIVSDDCLLSLNDIPRVLVTVLECINDSTLHFQFIETMMYFKQNLWMDLMMVISCSDGFSRVLATQLLFHYWPHLCWSYSKEHKLNPNCLYKTVSCENRECQSVSTMKTATAMIFNPTLSVELEKAMPLYLCQMCASDKISLRHQISLDLTLPSECIKRRCENKSCLSKNSTAIVTIFGGLSDGLLENTTAHDEVACDTKRKEPCFWHFDSKMSRYCAECYNNLQHVLECWSVTVQLAPAKAWEQDFPHITQLIVDVVATLLLEKVEFASDALNMRSGINFSYEGSNGSSPTDINKMLGKLVTYPCDGCKDNMGSQTIPETLSHFGIWLLGSLCPPCQNIEHDLASQLIATVLIWYKNNSCVASEVCRSILSLKKDSCVCQVCVRGFYKHLENWINEMYKFYFKEFLSCLLPNPVSESRVSGHWDSIYPLWFHYQEGLNLITCLASYSFISVDLWECLIPCWMTALCENLNPDELRRLESSLSALFDKDLSPLSFRSDETFRFVFESFKQPTLLDHENSLEWLQIFCEVDAYLPLSEILEMYYTLLDHLTFSVLLNNETLVSSKPNYLPPNLTESDFEKMMNQAKQPGVTSLKNLLEGMNLPCADVGFKSEYGDRLSVHTISETKKSLRRSGSNQSGKLLSSTLLRSRRSSRSRRTPSTSEAPDVEKLSRISKPSTSTLSSSSSRTPIKKRKLTAEWTSCRIISCYIDMIDIIHHQFLLQDLPQHTGLSNGLSAKIAGFLSSLLTHVVDHIGKRDRFSQSDDYPPHDDTELELTGELFELTEKLFFLLLPAEVSDTSDNASQSRSFNFSTSFNTSAVQADYLQASDFDAFGVPIQLFYLLLKALEFYALNHQVAIHIVRCIFHLSINGNLLKSLSEFDDPIIQSFNLELFIPCLWRQLDISQSDSSRRVVPVLFRAASLLENGFEIIINLFEEGLLEKSSGGDDVIEGWSQQFETLDRIQAFLMFIDNSVMQSRSPLTYLVAYVLCLLLAALGLQSTAIYTKAKFIIETLSKENFQMIYHCLQLEFDNSMWDRTFVLSQFLLLHKLRPDTSALSFSFFSHLIYTLAAEVPANIRRGMDCAFPSNSRLQRPAKQQKYDQALAADKKSFSITFTERFKRARLNVEICSDGMTRPSTKTEAEVDIDTVNHLMMAVCQYLIGCEDDIKGNTQRLKQFLRLFYAWIGYNEQVSYFTQNSSLIRSTIGICTFLKNLPQILDYNFTLGSELLPMILAFLQYIIKISGKNSHPSSSEFDLRILEDHDQVSLLKTLQVIMYKYKVTECIQREQLLQLQNTCLQTLQFEYHRCENKIKSSAPPSESKTNFDSQNKNRTLDKSVTENAENTSISKRCSSYLCKEQQDNEDTTPLLANTASSSRLDTICSVSLQIGDKVVRDNNAEKNDGNTQSSTLLTQQTGFNSPSSHPTATAVEDKKRNSDVNGEPIETRCCYCNGLIRNYSEETLSLCISNLCHFVRFSPVDGVPLLPTLLPLLSHIAEPTWDDEVRHTSVVMLTAQQSLRCLLHQLTENKICSSLFYMELPPDSTFFPVVISCLQGYRDFHCLDFLAHALEGLPENLNEINEEDLTRFLANLASYLFHLQHESFESICWQPVVTCFFAFFTKLNNYFTKTNVIAVNSVLEIMMYSMKAPARGHLKQCLLEPYSKILTTAIAKENFSTQLLYELCLTTCAAKDKEKAPLTRSVALKFISCFKSKTDVTGYILLMLMQIVLADCGSRINFPHIHILSSKKCLTQYAKKIGCVMACVKCHVNDLLDALADRSWLEHLNNTKHDSIPTTSPANHVIKEIPESVLQLSLAQIVAGSLHLYNEDCTQFRCLVKPPAAIQHGLKEYNECVTQIKKLSWILLGSLSHLGLQQGDTSNLWMPISFDIGPSLASIVQAVLTGYLEQSKASHMSVASLFYAFMFCQLWTVYCEQLSYFVSLRNVTNRSDFNNDSGTESDPTEEHRVGMLLLEFWSRLSSSVLVLLEKDGKISDSIRRHIASLIECLQQYDSPVLFKLYPMWSAMLDNETRKRFNVTQQCSNLFASSANTNNRFNLPGRSALCHSSACNNVKVGFTYNHAKLNALRVLDVVHSISGKLMRKESNQGLCVV